VREFEKRIKEKVFTTTWESETMTHSKDAILIDALEEIVEEAKKEFPFKPIKRKKLESGVDLVTFDYPAYIEYRNQVWIWFEKWFGNE